MEIPPNCHIEYNEEGEPMIVEDRGIVYCQNGLVDRYASGLDIDSYW